MLCHQHPADSAHAACQRCQRGLCRSCATQFQQLLCTHCIEQSATRRAREARRTLWLALPVFALAAWSTGLALNVAARPKLILSLLAGMVALGIWLGLRRWRRAPALVGGIALVPESETPFLERVLKPALAGVVFWPWLLIETLRDLQLANRLRAFVPAENRETTFGFGEASLAFASVAAAFTLGAHGLSHYTPVAGRVRSTEANLAASAQQAVRGKLASATPSAPVGSVAPVEPEPEPAVAEEPAAEPPASAPPPLPEVAPEVAPEVTAEVTAGVEEPVEARHRARRERRKRGEEDVEEAAPAEEAQPETAKREEPALEEPAPAAPPPVLDRRYVPGSEMAKQALSGSRAPDGSYVTSSGRVVIKAPPPAAK